MEEYCLEDFDGFKLKGKAKNRKDQRKNITLKTKLKKFIKLLKLVKLKSSTSNIVATVVKE